MRIDPQPDRLVKGALHAGTAFFLFTVMQALNKMLAGQHNVIEISFYRNALCLLPCLLYVAGTRNYALIRTGRPGALAYRAGLGAIGLLLTFGATQILPISNATVLFFTATLMVPVLAFIFLKEQIGPYRWGAVVVGMLGALMVAQPSAHMPLIGVVVALGAAATHALAQILLRSLRTEAAFTVTFYFFLGGTIITGLAMPFAFNPVSWHSALILSGIALSGGLGQYFLTTGFQAAPASVLAPIAYTGLLWAVLLDAVIWSFTPEWYIYAGGAVIIAANIFILYRERVRVRSNAARAVEDSSK